MKSYAAILAEIIDGHLLKVTMNRPEVGNAKNTQMGLDLLDLWTGLIDDTGDLRCVILTGKPFTAAQALEWGVLHRLCEPDELMPAVLETAQAMCDNAPLSAK